jgi:enamine deaminase RidA (YjgF/YER057c/UK114 family)
MKPAITRRAVTELWSEVVCYQGVAWWVEVAEDSSLDFAGQFKQILEQIDATCKSLGTDRTALLKVEIFLVDLADASTLNQLWKAWLPPNSAPVRACVGAQLSGSYQVEVIVTAAVA